MGFTKVGQKRRSTRDGKKWMVLAKKGDQYKVVHGGAEGMSDYTKHKDEDRRDRFWKRHNAGSPGKSKDPFSPLYWHKKFGTWQDGGEFEEEELMYGYDDDLLYIDMDEEPEEEEKVENPVPQAPAPTVNMTSSNPYKAMEMDAFMKYMGKKVVAQNIGVDKMEYLKDVERLTGTPAEILYGVYGAESGFGRSTLSPVGAKGPFQFMDGTAKEMGLSNPFDFNSSAIAAGKYLANLQKQFKDWNIAISAYNAGPGRIQNVLRGKQSLPKETRDYLPRVLNYASQFQK